MFGDESVHTGDCDCPSFCILVCEGDESVRKTWRMIADKSLYLKHIGAVVNVKAVRRDREGQSGAVECLLCLYVVQRGFVIISV